MNCAGFRSFESSPLAYYKYIGRLYSYFSGAARDSFSMPCRLELFCLSHLTGDLRVDRQIRQGSA